MDVNSCPDCKRYRLALIEAHDLITMVLDGGPGPLSLRQPKGFVTELGKLVAATASVKGKELSTVSLEAGFADDYVARVCRGTLLLNARAAKLIGDVLGLDLGEYVVATKRAPRKPKSAPAAPDLPGLSVPVAQGVNLMMGGERSA
jgi:hypothetical protein